MVVCVPYNAFVQTNPTPPAVSCHSRCDIQSVLEVGLGDASRCQRLMEWLFWQNPDVKLRYAAIDMFEAGGGISLKQFHSTVTQQGAKPLPIPGDLITGLPRVVHTIGAVDLLILSEDIDSVSQPQIASFLERALHESSLIFATDADEGRMYSLTHSELLSEIQQESISKAA